MKIRLVMSIFAIVCIGSPLLQAMESPQKGWARQKYEEFCARYPGAAQAAKEAGSVGAVALGAAGTGLYGLSRLRAGQSAKKHTIRRIEPTPAAGPLGHSYEEEQSYQLFKNPEEREYSGEFGYFPMVNQPEYSEEYGYQPLQR
jgi:hypothetical protein